MLKGHSINIYNNGQMERDFTLIDDLVEVITPLCVWVPARGRESVVVADSTSPVGRCRVVNTDGGRSVKQLHFIEKINRCLDRKAERYSSVMQAGDVVQTEASTDFLETLIGFKPATPVSLNINENPRWYHDYCQV